MLPTFMVIEGKLCELQKAVKLPNRCWRRMSSWTLSEWDCITLYIHTEWQTTTSGTYDDAKLHPTDSVTWNYTNWNCQTVSEDARHYGHCQGDTALLYVYIHTMWH